MLDGEIVNENYAKQLVKYII